MIVNKYFESKCEDDTNTNPDQYISSENDGTVVSYSSSFNEFHSEILNNNRFHQFNLCTKSAPNSPGKHISLCCNHFQILSAGKPVYQYLFEITPYVPSKKLNRKILSIVELSVEEFQQANLVYDGWNTVYSTINLDLQVVNSLVIPMEGLGCDDKNKSSSFKVHMEFVDYFLLDNSAKYPESVKVMYAMDTILRQKSCDQFSVVLKSFFSTSPQQDNLANNRFGWGSLNLGVGREVCYGFYQSVVESFDTVTLNIDVATTTFYRPMQMVEFLADVLGVPLKTVTDGRAIGEGSKKKFSKEVNGIKIETKHCNNSPRRYRVVKCTSKPAANISFAIEGDEDREISLAEYYKSRYNIELKYLHLPCLEVGKTRECILPLELCYIVPGQRCLKKLNEQQIANLIRATSRNAQERKDAVLKIRDKVGISEDVYATNYGLTVENRMLKLEGKVLPPPKLLYCSPHTGRKNCFTVPNNGTWDMRGKNFYIGIEIKVWAVVCFTDLTIVTKQNLRSFVSSLTKVAKEIGMPFVNGPSFCKYATPEEACKILEFLKSDYPDIQLIICVVPGKSIIYGDVKRKGDLMGLTTQCIRSHNVIKSSAHTLSNLCMKINSKLGGVNLVISPPAKIMTSDPVLFVGCHLSRNTLLPETSENGMVYSEKSICCLVGSRDGHPTKFSSTFRIQPRHLNVISDINEMMREIIITFYSSTGFKPHRIVVYRSGMNDTNLDEVMQHELRGIRNACSSIETGYQPGITIIGIDVTHHTRFFALNNMDRMGSSMNVPAGTLVETGVTVNNLFEFFLVSHAGIQGTSRPTKYTVLWDDNSFTGEDIYDLTYQLCHTQSRCTRSVSIPSPVYYARLVAQRAKILVMGDNFNLELYKDMVENSEGMFFT